jgi:carboxylesterase type B
MKLPPKDGPLLPIIFFIHGGAYAVGSSNEYGPSYLMSQDIVLVTVNYRLGVFGFLSTGTTACAGNW